MFQQSIFNSGVQHTFSSSSLALNSKVFILLWFGFGFSCSPLHRLRDIRLVLAFFRSSNNPSCLKNSTIDFVRTTDLRRWKRQEEDKYCTPENFRKRSFFVLFVNFLELKKIKSLQFKFPGLKCIVKRSHFWKLVAYDMPKSPFISLLKFPG